MPDPTAISLGDWQLGISPQATGLRVRSLGRVVLPLGEALRLVMEDPDAAGHVVCVQYSIDTDAGPWALWISCPSDDLDRHEAILGQILPVSTSQPQDVPPSFHPRRAPLAGWDEG
jgi:hypothetical protein